MDKARIDQQNMERARIYQESLPPEAQASLREEAFDFLEDHQKGLVLRKTPGAEMLLKIAMTRICLGRMKVSQPDLFSAEA